MQGVYIRRSTGRLCGQMLDGHLYFAAGEIAEHLNAPRRGRRHRTKLMRSWLYAGDGLEDSGQAG